MSCKCVLSVAAASLAGFASIGVVFAQETFVIAQTRAVTPDAPRTELIIRASFRDTDFAFGGGRWNMEAGDGEFVDGYCLGGPCDPLPDADGRFIYRMYGGQLHFPAAGVFADPSNPLPIAIAEWQADDFGPRDVPVVTFETSLFQIYPDEASGASESRLDTFEEGTGVIRVRRCYTDCDGDDAATIFDFLCFFNAFESGDFYADCDESGELDLFDFLCFQQEFIAGCP